MNTPYGAGLSVKVVNYKNAAVSGVDVTFSAPTSGASATFNGCSGFSRSRNTCVVQTNRQGVATAYPTANATSGSFVVSASATGVSGRATFNLTNIQPTFSMLGTAVSTLYPGTSSPINITFTNPQNAPVTLVDSSLVVSISTTSPKGNNSCPVNNFFTSLQSFLRAQPRIRVPAMGSISLSTASLGINQRYWPVISMLLTNTNQNGCAGATVHFNLSGQAVG